MEAPGEETHGLPEGEVYLSTRGVEIDDSKWFVVMHWGEVRGVLEVVGVEVWSRPPFADPDLYPGTKTFLDPEGEPITTTVLRRLNLGSMIAKAREDVVKFSQVLAMPESGFPAATQAEAADALDKLTRTGRPSKYDDRHFVEVARTYQAAYNRGHSPTRAVAQHFGVSQAQAAKWVSIARNKYGLLAATRKGQASGTSRRDDGDHADTS